MEFRVFNLIKQYGNWSKQSDIELIYNRLLEVMPIDDETPSRDIKSVVLDLVKCDSCGEYETEYFTMITTLVLDENGGGGRMCYTCRGNG